LEALPNAGEGARVPNEEPQWSGGPSFSLRFWQQQPKDWTLNTCVAWQFLFP